MTDATDAETLAEQVAKIQPGDWAHVVFLMPKDAEGPRTALGEWEAMGEVWADSTGWLYVGLTWQAIRFGQRLDSARGTYLLAIKEHRPAPRPFYTNRPASRQPRRGDMIDHPALGLLVYRNTQTGWLSGGNIVNVDEPGKYPLAGELFEDGQP